MQKGGLLRYASCQNPHNHQVAAVFGFTERLALHLFMQFRPPSGLTARFEKRGRH